MPTPPETIKAPDEVPDEFVLEPNLVSSGMTSNDEVAEIPLPTYNDSLAAAVSELEKAIYLVPVKPCVLIVSDLLADTAKPELVEDTANPALVEDTANPALVEETANPALVEDTAKPALVEETAKPALVDDTAKPAFVEETAKPALVDDTAKPALVAVVALPLKVVAVTVFPTALTPESTYTGVLPIEALLLEPVKNI
jgi:hypothetical protein